MGSLDRAVLNGFICRLCSEMHRYVMHIFGDEGLRLCIAEKISRYLSIHVMRSDPLPKTICKTCLERLENQHKLVMVMEQAAQILKMQQLARAQPGHGCVLHQGDSAGNPNNPPIP